MNVVLKEKPITMSPQMPQSAEKTMVAIPHKVLQYLLKEKKSGKLIIQDPHDASVQWCIYVGNGKIHFAGSMVGMRDRLSYLLEQYFPNEKFYIPHDLECDHQYLCQQWHSGKLGLPLTRNILTLITREALLFSLVLPRAMIKFEKMIGLNPILLALDLKFLMMPIKNEMRHWVNLRGDISSPFMRPTLVDEKVINNFAGLNDKEKKQIKSLKDYFKDQCSFYKIGTYTKQKILTLAELLHPAVAVGGISILPYQKMEKQERPLIACIDDSPAIQRVIKMTLKAGGFDVVSITEPAKAMSNFVRQKPDLILMDINMPEIDGYKLAYMLRQSTLLQDIPIMMLTGRDGVLDRVKARMVGAVGYICKPFNPQELIQYVRDNLQK